MIMMMKKKWILITNWMTGKTGIISDLVVPHKTSKQTKTKLYNTLAFAALL